MNTSTTSRDFAARLFHEIDASEQGNLFLSPFSIQVALAMCAVGARGNTRKALANLIGAPENVDDQNRHYATLLKSVNGAGERPFELTTANALWGQHGFAFHADFARAVATYYDGAFNEVDFLAQPDEAVKVINTWVEGKTAGKIKNLIQRSLIDQSTRLVLTNAIYFKGQWETEFDKTSTREEAWHARGGARQAPLMNRQGDFAYCEGDDFQALELPYKGEQLALLVVLPNKNDGLASLESKWAAEDLVRTVTGSLQDVPVLVTLPRFKVESTFTLKPVLCAMGAELAFSDAADFSGISAESLKISEVVHKAFVDVNEEGTEAAAATGVAMAKCAFSPAEPKVFRADHPFLFVIRDRTTNVVLFAGRVTDPG